MKNINTPLLGNKRCPHCIATKPVLDFNTDKSRPCGLQSWCRACQRDKNKVYNAVNGRSKNLQNRYGVTLEDKKRMLEEQDFKCANPRCSKELVLTGNAEDKAAKRIAELDHCHVTNKVRGILCKGCNVALGAVHDNTEVLLGLFSYLYTWKTKEHLNA